MNTTLLRALVLAVPVGALLVASCVALTKARTGYAWCWLIGASGLALMVLTHVAEALHWFPQMRWGQPDSTGHYLDLASAIGGVTFLVAGTIVRITDRQHG